MNFQKWHHRLKRRLLLETAVAYIHIHGFEQIGHLLLTPHQFLVTFGRYRHKDAHVKQILIVVGNTRFDKIACLDGVGQFLIVSAGILHTFEFGPVEPDPLCYLVDGFAAVFPSQMDIHIDSFTSIDKGRHPTGPHPVWESVGADI